jgi:hypothetical protein
MVFSSYINNRFVIAAVRRSVLTQWQACLMDSARFKRSLASSSRAVTAVPEDAIASALCWLVPHERVIKQMLCTLWRACIEEKAAKAYNPVAAYDGYVCQRSCDLSLHLTAPHGWILFSCSSVVRWDVTFRVQSGVYVSDGPRSRHKVSAGVLTVCGVLLSQSLNCLNLCAPQALLVPIRGCTQAFEACCSLLQSWWSMKGALRSSHEFLPFLRVAQPVLDRTQRRQPLQLITSGTRVTVTRHANTRMSFLV